MASSSYLDSEATFTQQAEEVGLSDVWLDALKHSSLATFAKLSFAVTSPGVGASDAQITAFSKNIWPNAAPTIADKADFERILLRAKP